jgi:hypothetical protein
VVGSKVHAAVSGNFEVGLDTREHLDKLVGNLGLNSFVDVALLDGVLLTRDGGVEGESGGSKRGGSAVGEREQPKPTLL